jgi:hypothetical protein
MLETKELLLISFLLFAACQSTSEPIVEEKTGEMQEIKMELSLSDLLEEKKAAFNETADDVKKDKYARGIEAVETAGTLVKALKVGEKVSLQSYLVKGKLHH